MKFIKLFYLTALIILSSCLPTNDKVNRVSGLSDTTEERGQYKKFDSDTDKVKSFADSIRGSKCGSPDCLRSYLFTKNERRVRLILSLFEEQGQAAPPP